MVTPFLMLLDTRFVLPATVIDPLAYLPAAIAVLFDVPGVMVVAP
nr:MAG TPA: hypothetical protein [Bacteriophage sp.]